MNEQRESRSGKDVQEAEVSDSAEGEPTQVETPKKPRLWIRLLRFAVLIYVTLVAMLLFFETALVYPAPPISRDNWLRPDLEFEDVSFTSDDGTQLHGWYFEHPNPRAHLIFFHGNAQQVASLGDYMNALRSKYAISAFAFDYRGYGKSEGKPNEKGLLEDGEAAQRWLAKRAGIPPSEIVLYGLSLGGGVAVNAASTQGAKALVLDRTFDSMVRTAASHYPWVPVGLLMRNRYPSDQRIAKYSGPLLQMHGPPDEIVPFEGGKRLFDACPSEKKVFLEMESLTHLDPPPPEFYAALERLLDQVTDK